MAYNKETDYKKLIDDAAARGDFGSAAQYEQQRNEKIAGEGMNYGQTNDYSGNLDKTDYASQLKGMISGGASADDVQSTLDKRVNKANSALNLNKYAYDDIYKSAMDYINGKKREAAKPTFTSKYSGQIDSIVNEIMNGSFDDYLKSDDYASLAKEYTAKGKKAMQDTTADVAARTGGLASSYAVTAGSQSYDNFMTELENMAREMYGDKTDALYKQADLLKALDDGDYNRYLDLLDQYNTENETAYNHSRDTISDQRYEDETAYNRKSSIAETMAGIGDFSGLKALGYTDDQIKELTAAFKAEQATAAKKSSSGGGSGSRSGSSGGGSGKGTSSDSSLASMARAADLFASKGGNVDAWFNQHYADYGYKSKTAAKSAYQEYNTNTSLENSTILQSGMAKNLLAMAKDPTRSADLIATRINTAYDSGTISEEEADYLLSVIGG